MVDIHEEHRIRLSMPEYTTRQSRLVWVIQDDFSVIQVYGYALNGKYPENPSPDKMLWFPTLGVSSYDFFDSEAEARVARKTRLQIEITKLEERLTTLRYLERMSYGK